MAAFRFFMLEQFMINIHPDDMRAIQNITGWDNVPEKHQRAYDAWIRMKHRSGFTGPLGLLVVPFLWNQGIRPKAEPKRTTHINWRDIELGQRVKVYDNGVLREGVFAGLVEAGSVAARLDGEALVREFPSHLMSLHESQISTDIDVESMMGGTVDTPDNRVKMLGPRMEDAEEQQEEVKVIEDEQQPQSLGGQQFKDASIFAAGDVVMVEVDGLVHDAEFVEAADEGKVTVHIDGLGKQTVDLSQVST